MCACCVSTFCCVIQDIASWKLLPDSSQAPKLPLVLFLLTVPLIALWTPFSWSLHISNLPMRDKRKDVELVQRGRESRGRKRARERKSSSRPHYVVVGLSVLSQVHRKAFQFLDGVFCHRHVVFSVPRAAALQGISIPSSYKAKKKKKHSTIYHNMS